MKTQTPTAAHHVIDIRKATAHGRQLVASNDPQAVEFVVGDRRYSLESMLEANDVDEDCCEWLRSAKPGDVYEQMHAERVQAVRS
jgi:hypothetical protein